MGPGVWVPGQGADSLLWSIKTVSNSAKTKLLIYWVSLPCWPFPASLVHGVPGWEQPQRAPRGWCGPMCVSER